ncbi:hypothetical protein [Ruegeria arenilitoris]|uniref:hypothetical protein n=1 Tax=Ruegeria arenilitoris TaxID=1173585 RepID=UPI00147A6DEF|nr:hypothetical protein [Ruegeria arenilitoris]
MQVVFHAGVAFTDEGRVLASLTKNASALATHGAAFFGPRRYKRVFKPAFDRFETATAELLAQQTIEGILPSGGGTRRAIYSSGSFAGDPEMALQDGQLYPFAGRRMALLEHSFRDHEVELFMGLRNPGSFVPKLLMSLPEEARTDAIRDTDLSCLSWIGMIEDIRDLAPNVQITLWGNEDTPFIWGDIIRALAGLDEDTPLEDEHDLLLSLLDETGRNEVLTLTSQDAAQSKAILHENMARIFDNHAQPEEIEEELHLPGWSTEIVDAFSELYEQDLERLGSIPGVRVLKP